MERLDTVRGLFRLYVWNSGLDISRNIAYRFNFIVGTLISLAHSCVAPIVQYLIFTSTNGYPGWTVSQLILFQGVLLFWSGLRTMLFGRVFFEAMNLVRKGDFDRLLVKPYPPIGVLLSSGFQLNGLAPTLAGLVIIVVSAVNLELVVHWWTVPLFVLVLGFGILLYIAFLILLCTVVIMLVQLGRLGDMFEKILAFSDYPVSIYPRALKTFFSIVLPFAIWIYFPSQVLLNRLEPTLIWGGAVSIGLFLLSNKVWKICLKQYTSAGG